MKNTFRLIGIIGGTDAAYTKPKCSFAKAKLRGLKIAGMLFLILMFGFGIIGCDEPEKPATRNETINFTFGGASANLRTTMLQAEHNVVKTKVINAINDAYNNKANSDEKEDYELMLATNITIEVGNRPAGKTYETTVGVLYLNLTALNTGISRDMINTAILRLMNDISYIE